MNPQPPTLPQDLPEDPTQTCGTFSITRQAASLPSSSRPSVAETALAAWTVRADDSSRTEVDPRAESLAGRPTLALGPGPGETLVEGETTRGPGGSRTRAEAEAVQAPGPLYRLERMVARGGMGEVWEARQEALARQVAVKRIRVELLEEIGQDPDMRARVLGEFRQEALAAARLDHPNIVPVHDLGEGPAGEPLLAMKLARGEPWRKLLREDFGRLSEADFLAKHLPILLDVAQAVAFAHSRGIVHRDLKPGQVMIGGFGETLLMDWGLAVFCGSEAFPGEGPAGLPTPATACGPAGTPSLMAPEQTDSNALRVGPWTDVYLLGGTLYQLLTGDYPHEAESSVLAMRLAREGKVEPPAERAPGRAIPPALADLAMEALRPAPAERLGSAEEFARRLQDYLSGSSRRQESEALRREAEREFRDFMEQAPRLSAQEIYVRHAELFHKMETVLRFWPGNAQAARLRDRNLSAWLEREIEHGDLLLAQVHLDQLAASPGADPARVEELREAFGKALRGRDRRARQRQALIVLAAGLFCAALLLAWEASASAERARQDRERALESSRLAAQNASAAKARGAEAQKAREQAEDLIGFIVDDLDDELAPIGRLDIVKRAALKARDYYASAPAGANGRESLRRRVSAMMNLVDVLLRQGAFEDAAQTAREGFALAEAWAAEVHPDNGEERLRAACALADARLVLADSLGRLPGSAAEALNLYEESLALYDEGLGLAPEAEKPEIMRSRMVAMINLGNFLNATLDLPEDALDIMEKAIAAGEEALRLDPGLEETLLSRLLVARANFANLLRATGQTEKSLPAYEALLEQAGALVRREPDNFFWRQSLGDALSQKGAALAELGEFSRAVELREEAAGIFRELVKRDPTNHNWGLKLAAALYNRAALLFNELDRLDEALEGLLEARGVLLDPARFDPAKADRQTAEFLTDVFLGLMRARFLKDDVAGLRNDLGEFAIPAVRGMAESQAGSAPVARAALPSLLYVAACQAALDDSPEEAWELLSESCFAGYSRWRLVAEDPDLETLRQGNPDRFQALLDRMRANGDEGEEPETVLEDAPEEEGEAPSPAEAP